MTAVADDRPADAATVPRPFPDSGEPGRRWLLAALGAAVPAGVLAGLLAVGPTPVLALLFPLLLVPVLVWRRPSTGVVLLFAGIVVLEQFHYLVGDVRDGTFTSHIPFVRTVVPGTFVQPVELLYALVLLCVAMQALRDGTRVVHWTPLLTRLAVLNGLALVFFAVGLSRGGDLQIAVFELRPFLYLLLAYVLAASLLTTAGTVRALLWLLVLGCAFKAALGIVIFFDVWRWDPRPEAVLAHEESFFFGLYVFLTLGAWLFGVRGRLRTVATTLLPVVLLADMVNSRRTAWAILICGTALLLVLAYSVLPDRRHVLRRIAVVGAVLVAAYLPLFWNGNGTLAQPARAIRSVIAPDARDEASNQYRLIESLNLEHNIRATGGTGSGFGTPIDYVIPIPDILDIASMIAYVPHNTIYWVWMRLGVLGMLVLWLVVAEALRTSSSLARHGRGEVALLGAVTACAVVAWVIMGEKDLGLYWSRLAVGMGVLLGAVEAQARVLRRVRQPLGPVPSSEPSTRGALATSSRQDRS